MTVPRSTCPAAGAPAAPRGARGLNTRRPAPCVLYVDTDNQRHGLAKPLLEHLTAAGHEVRGAHLFGNNCGFALTQWHATLLQSPALGRATRAHVVPSQPQAADVALMLALGERWRDHAASGEQVMIVSADLALAACAEQLASLGLSVQLVHEDGRTAASLPHSRVRRLPLAVTSTARPCRFQVLLELVRGLCPTFGGGYRKCAVGAVLQGAGLDRADRDAFLAKVPGLQERQVDGERVLYF